MFGLFEGSAAPQIRRIGVQEGAGCAILHAASFTYAWPQDDIEALLIAPSSMAHGAFGPKSDDLQAFILSRLAADEAEILSIAVSPRRRGKGVAGRLLTTHIEHLSRAGAKSLFLEVEAENEAARALYARFSFVTVGERRSYYRKPDGSTALAFVMRRTIA